MVSKGMTVGLVGLLVLALIGGSAYILLRPDDASVAQSGVGYNQGNKGNEGQGNGSQGGGRNQGEAVAGLGRQGGGSQGEGQGQGQAAAEQGGQGFGGGGGSGKGREEAGEVNGEGLADHPSEAWTTLTGPVVTFEGDTLVVQTGEGSVAVHLGPEWYWEAEGINIADGQQVEVTGFYEDDSFEATRVGNLDTGAVVTLRDETGRPMWAGRGRQGQGGSSRS